MYFLIDTNIFIDFVAEGKDEEFIRLVLWHAENEKIVMLVPDILLLEWKEKKKKTLEFKAKQIKLTKDRDPEETEKEFFNHVLTRCRKRAEEIDALLNNGAKF